MRPQKALFLMVFTCVCFCGDSEASEWRRQSQSVQRDLPRPTDVNTSILRGAPHRDQKFRELYKVQICQ